MDIRVIQSAVPLAGDLDGGPLGHGAVEVDILQRSVIAEGADADGFHRVGQGDGFQAGAVVEGVIAQIGDAAGHRGGGQLGHLAADGIAHSPQAAGQRDRGDAVAVGEGVGLDGGNAAGDGDGAQSGAAQKQAGADALQAAGQRDGGQLGAVGEHGIAQLRNAAVHHDLVDALDASLGTPWRGTVAVVIHVVVIRGAGTADGQGAGVVQRPGGAVAALAAGQRGGVGGVHHAQRKGAEQHENRQQDRLDTFFHRNSPFLYDLRRYVPAGHYNGRMHLFLCDFNKLAA